MIMIRMVTMNFDENNGCYGDDDGINNNDDNAKFSLFGWIIKHMKSRDKKGAKCASQIAGLFPVHKKNKVGWLSACQ